MTKHEVLFIAFGFVVGAILSAILCYVLITRLKALLREAVKQAAFLDAIMTDLHRRIGHLPFFPTAYKAAIKKTERLEKLKNTANGQA